jgi:3-hydroxyisobutyrate dehydrogenase-like beta-hydroxyacid dehydrogenase
MPHNQRIGVLGVGRMGLPIARNLAASGFAVTVFDMDDARSRAADTPVARSATDLARSSDILMTVLPGIREVEEAMVGPDGVLDSLPAGSLWLDLTSNDPRVATRIEDRASARGVGAVGAPMAGGVAAAEERSIRFFVAGASSAVERAHPILSALGSVNWVADEIGSGYTAKLLSNLLWFGQVVAVTEAMLLGQSLGLPPSVLRDQLAASAGASVFVDEYLDRLLVGDYLETFGIDRCVEELDTLASLAEDAGVPFELSSTVARLHREALERFGAVDGELLTARLLEERAGSVLRSSRSEAGTVASVTEP